MVILKKLIFPLARSTNIADNWSVIIKEIKSWTTTLAHRNYQYWHHRLLHRCAQVPNLHLPPPRTRLPSPVAAEVEVTSLASFHSIPRNHDLYCENQKLVLTNWVAAHIIGRKNCCVHWQIHRDATSPLTRKLDLNSTIFKIPRNMKYRFVQCCTYIDA